MPNKILSLRDYQIKAGDQFFFDNNIWMYLLCPIGNYNVRKQNQYSNFLNYVIQRKNPIFVNSLILSEFSNRYLKLDFNILRMRKENAGRFNDYKKDYVGSPEFRLTTILVKSQITSLLRMCQKCSDEFNAINVDDVLKLFKTIGFNDSYYSHLASLKRWIIISDDSDFTNNKLPDLGLTILTS